MSFSLQVSGGDLVVNGSTMGYVHGASKLRQQLVLWLFEAYGIDPMHPQYGSLLQDYVGTVLTYSTQALLYSEIMRVLDNYQRLQYQEFKKTPQIFSMSELLWSINDVQVSSSYDTVSAQVAVSNGQNQTVQFNVNQTNQGAST